MNNFYLDLLYVACKKTHTDFNSISDKEKTISIAINMLSEKDRDFIEFLKPIYQTNDPNGVVSMKNSSETRKIFHMNSHQQKKYRTEVTKKLIKNMVKLIS